MQSNEKLMKLNNSLPRGSYSEIAFRTGYNVNTVKNVLSGKKNATLIPTMEIVREADKLLAEYQELMGVDTIERSVENEKV